MDLTTPASLQLTWYLQVMNSDPRGLSVEEINRHLTTPPDSTDDELRAAWALQADNRDGAPLRLRGCGAGGDR